MSAEIFDMKLYKKALKLSKKGKSLKIKPQSSVAYEKKRDKRKMTENHSFGCYDDQVAMGLYDFSKAEVYQRKMTKKEAEEWVKHNTDESIHSFIGEQLQKAYIAGATENGIQWHDLRKDPNALPKDENVVTVIYHDCDRYNTYSALYDTIAENWLYYNFDEGVWERLTYEVIAWCEIPQFKE